MDTMQLINLSGLTLNIIGTILLAISLNKYLTSLHASIVFHDLTIKALLNQQQKVPYADGLDNVLKKGTSSSKIRTTLGLTIIVIGFTLQLIPLLSQMLNNCK